MKIQLFEVCYLVRRYILSLYGFIAKNSWKCILLDVGMKSPTGSFSGKELSSEVVDVDP